MSGKAELAFTSPQAMDCLARHVAAGDVPRVQSRRASLVEAAVQTSCGYVLALVTQAIVFPLAGIEHVSTRAHLGIGAAFVAVSLARGYVLRRLFARL